MTSSLKDCRKSAGLFFVTLLICLFLAEAGLRFIFNQPKPPQKPTGWAIIPEASWIEYHPTLGWFHQKNKNSTLLKNDRQLPLSTNSLGLRGKREYAKEKPKSVTRVYAAGDSFTFGFGVLDSETFPFQMEMSHPQLEVFNLGVPGYGVDQIYLLVKDFGFDYQPDVVFLTLYPEDFWRATRAFNDAGYGKPYFSLAGNEIQLRHVPVPKNKNFSVNQFPDLDSSQPVMKILRTSYLFKLSERLIRKLKKRTGSEDPDTSQEWLLGREILKKAIAEIRKHDALPVLVIAPPHRWISGTDEPIRESLIRLAHREGVDIIDLTPVFLEAVKKSSIDDYYIPEDQHWTARGNRLVASVLFKHLKSKGLLHGSNR